MTPRSSRVGEDRSTERAEGAVVPGRTNGAVDTRNISVVIVSWNAKEHLRRCLDSLHANAWDCVAKVVVVDNASTDGSPEMVAGVFPDVVLVRCERNLGFAKANNIGFAHVHGKFVALINSDVIVHPDCLQRLAAVLEANETIGVLGPRIEGTDGLLQLTCRRLPGLWNTFCRLSALDRVFSGTALFSGFELPAASHRTQSDVEALGGCFWLVRAEAIARIGGLDERFFFYAEDVDWCKRFRENGWRIVYCPEATATHYGGGSSETVPYRYSVEIIRSTLKYWKKHHGRWGQSICFVMIFCHHALRLVLRLCKRIACLDASAIAAHKIREDIVCLRWLVTGRDWSGPRGVTR